MTKSTNSQREQESEGGLYEPSDAHYHIHRHSGECDESVCVEVATCCAYARLLDDPLNNNIDYPWEWREPLCMITNGGDGS